MSGLRLKLADGTEIEARIEGAISGQLRELLASGYAGNQMRIAADDGDDVEGHAVGSTVRLRLYDEDDVEGHALSLRLPNADAARDLQRKLLAAGVVGVIVVGAATTTFLVADQGPSSGAGAISAPAVPAPAVPPGVAGELKGQDIAIPAAVPAPAVPPGVAGELKGQDIAVPAAVPAPAVPPGVAGELKGGDVAAAAPPATVPAPAVAPGLAAEIKGQDEAGTAAPVTTDDPAETRVGRPGEPRAQ